MTEKLKQKMHERWNMKWKGKGNKQKINKRWIKDERMLNKRWTKDGRKMNKT